MQRELQKCEKKSGGGGKITHLAATCENYFSPSPHKNQIFSTKAQGILVPNQLDYSFNKYLFPLITKMYLFVTLLFAFCLHSLLVFIHLFIYSQGCILGGGGKGENVLYKTCKKNFKNRRNKGGGGRWLLWLLHAKIILPLLPFFSSKPKRYLFQLSL